MELYFLRHGLAREPNDPPFKDDSLRPLTAEGMEKIRLSALGMQTLGLNFDAIISSPYVRARQTALIVAKAYKIKKSAIHLTKNLLPPATINDLLKETFGFLGKSKNILLVGHEPHLTQLISSLLSGDQLLEIDLKKGSLCCLSLKPSFNKNQAVLNWLLTSTQLGLLSFSKPKVKR